MNDFSQELPDLKDLYNKYIANEMSEEEFNKLYDGLSEPEKESLVFELMTETWKTTTPLPVFMYDEPAEPDTNSNKKIFFLKTGWWRMAAAAIIIVTAGSYVWSIQNNKQKAIPATAIAKPVPEVMPAADKSTLTLADGTVIALDTATNGTLAQQGNIKVLKLNAGQLSYNNGSSLPEGSEVMYNTIATSKGGKYQIILPDGTNVWLNAASSLRFPAVFPADKREIEITGEAYFDVVKDATKPFTIKANTVTYDVLGTSFNIRSYPEDEISMTTLVDGKLRLKNKSNSTLLDPGQYSCIVNNNIGSNYLLGPFPPREGHIEATLSWMKGLFVFNRTNINMIMGDFARWYDVDVIYNGDMRFDHFTGKISRSVPLSKALKLLEMTNTLHFKLKGRTIEVSH